MENRKHQSETSKLSEISTVMNQKKALSDLKTEMVSKRDSIKGSMDMGMLDVDDILSKYSEEDIEKMSIEDMNKIFTDENGKFIFDRSTVNDSMAKDFIKYLKISQNAFIEIDKQSDLLDESMKEFSSDIESIMGNKASFNKTMRASLEKDINNPEVDEYIRTRCVNVLAAMDDAVTLAPLFKIYDGKDGVNRIHNTYNDFKNEKIHKNILNAYIRKCSDAGIEPRLLKLGNLMTQGVDSSYTKDDNLFVFIIIRYIKYNNLTNYQVKTFVVQLTTFIKEIMMGETSTQYESDKEEINKLKVSIVSLLAKFYN